MAIFSGYSAGVKVGMIVPFSGTQVPDGFLICDGSAISRTLYSDLFAAIGTTYGSGDGSTTFNLPNAICRVFNSSTLSIQGTGKSLGLTNGSANFAFSTSDYRNGAGVAQGAYNLNVGSGGIDWQTFVGPFGLTTNSSQSGLVANVPAFSLKYLIKY